MRQVACLAGGRSGSASWRDAAGLEIAGITADSRRVAPGYPVRRTSRQPRRTAAPSSPRRCRAVPWRCWRPRAPSGRPACRRGRCWRIASRAARLAQLAAGLAGSQPRDRGRGDRDQRQDQHGRFPAPDLDRGRQRRPPALGTLGPDAPGLRSGPRPDHAGSGGAGCRRWRGSPAPASSTRRWRPRRTASISSAWTACGWRPAAFTNLTRDHLDYHGSRGGLSRRQAAAVRRELLPTGAPAVANSRHGCRRRWPRCATSRRGGGSIFSRSARPDRRSRLLAAEPRPDGQVLRIDAGGVRREVMLPLPGRFQADNALMAAALAARARRARCAGPARPRCAACAAGWNWRRACRTAPRSMSITPIRPMRWSGC